MARLRNDDGFGLVELIIAMTVLNIALMAVVAAFTSGTVAVSRAARVTVGATIADAQMETYRAMTYRDIGIDTSATFDTTYTGDAACQNTTTSRTCATHGVASTETLPTGSNNCTTINAWFPNTLPCTGSRTVSASTTPASPDGLTYRIDTYIVLLAATSGTGSLSYRSRKQVTVVVRDVARNNKILARETSIFDCSTGATPNSTEC